MAGVIGRFGRIDTSTTCALGVHQRVWVCTPYITLWPTAVKVSGEGDLAGSGGLQYRAYSSRIPQMTRCAKDAGLRYCWRWSRTSKAVASCPVRSEGQAVVWRTAPGRFR